MGVEAAAEGSRGSEEPAATRGGDIRGAVRRGELGLRPADRTVSRGLAESRWVRGAGQGPGLTAAGGALLPTSPASRAPSGEKMASVPSLRALSRNKTSLIIF